MLGETYALILGAFLAGIVGILTAYVNRRLEEKRNKVYIIQALKIEIVGNQRILKGIEGSMSEIDDIVKSYAKQDETIIAHDEDDAERFLFDFLKGFRFERTVYTALSNKIGMLDDKISEGLFAYYVTLSSVEMGYLMFFRAFLHIKDAQRKEKTRKKLQSWIETAYRTGEKLLEDIDKSLSCPQSSKA